LPNFPGYGDNKRIVLGRCQGKAMVNKKLAHRTLCAKKSSLFYSNNEEATKGVETYFLY
jgi:hypothetical protein